MKHFLGGAIALVLLSGVALADVKITMKADAGIAGGDDFTLFYYGDGWVDEGDTFAHTDIFTRISLRSESDAGWTFGASIDLEDTAGEEGSVPDDARVWISGSFGTLSVGDFDGALDWAMREAHIGRTINDVEKHIGWSGNSGLDGRNDGNILRYTYGWENLEVAASVEPGRSSFREPVWGVGAKYTFNHDMGDVVFGLGYQETKEIDWADESIWGLSIAAEFYNGFEAILNYSHYKLNNVYFDDADWEFTHVGLALAYTYDAWSFSLNWGRFDGDGDTASRDDNYSGQSFVVNYDLGGGAEIQAGYGKGTLDQSFSNEDYDQWSLGISMVF